MVIVLHSVLHSGLLSLANNKTILTRGKVGLPPPDDLTHCHSAVILQLRLLHKAFDRMTFDTDICSCAVSTLIGNSGESHQGTRGTNSTAKTRLAKPKRAVQELLENIVIGGTNYDLSAWTGQNQSKLHDGSGNHVFTIVFFMAMTMTLSL